MKYYIHIETRWGQLVPQASARSMPEHSSHGPAKLNLLSLFWGSVGFMVKLGRISRKIDWWFLRISKYINPHNPHQEVPKLPQNLHQIYSIHDYSCSFLTNQIQKHIQTSAQHHMFTKCHHTSPFSYKAKARTPPTCHPLSRVPTLKALANRLEGLGFQYVGRLHVGFIYSIFVCNYSISSSLFDWFMSVYVLFCFFHFFCVPDFGLMRMVLVEIGQENACWSLVTLHFSLHSFFALPHVVSRPFIQTAGFRFNLIICLQASLQIMQIVKY